MQTVWLAFLTGLTTGGISCLAVQGGLLASSSAQEQRVGYRHVGMFLLAKLVGHIILGFLLGAIGSTLLFSPRISGFVQTAAGLFMLATAARMLELHPIFRYAVIQPPRWTYRFLRRISRDDSSLPAGRQGFTPVALGFFTILMPCGVTQATMVVAMASGSPWLGALIMGAFILGTSPIFFFLGAAVITLLKRKAFTYAAASVVAVFAMLSINGGIGLTGSFYTFQNIVKAASIDIDELVRFNATGMAAIGPDGRQHVIIDVAKNGYASSTQVLKRGVPVELELRTNNTKGCTRAFTIPEFGIVKSLPATGEEVVEFTPMRTGQLSYVCGMGMYGGYFTVIP